MINQSDPNLSAGDIARALSRHSKKALVIFLLGLTVTTCWIVFLPGEYESIAKVYVRVGRENNTLDPSATTGQTVNIQQTLESEINSMLQILDSREAAEMVVDEIGVDRILANDLPEDGLGTTRGGSTASSTSWLKNVKRWISDIKDQVLPNRFSESRHALAIRSIQNRSTFWAPKKSSVIEICVEAGHPRLAQMIASAWKRAFITEHLRVTRTEGSLDFFVAQVKELENRIADTEEQLKQAKSSSGLVSIEGQRTVLEDQATSIRTRWLANKSLLASSQAKVTELKSILASLPKRAEADQRTAESDPGWNALREKLFELQIKEQDLKSRYSDLKAEVIAVVEQRKAIEAILATQPKSTSETISSPNPTYQFFQQSLLNEQSLVAALVAEQQTLETQIHDNLTEITELNQNAVAINELERRLLNLETSYLASVTRMEQAKTLEGLETANISSVNSLQDASYDAVPAGMGRMKKLALGLLMAITCSIGIVAISEYFNRSFVTPAQVENALDVPVLVSISEGRRRFIELGHQDG
jgi:uncharacterized protein involved in exopolysaccharide biosynthesis